MPSNYELAEQGGVLCTREEFWNTIVYNFARNYREMTVETFLCHTDKANEYCNLIRKKLRAPELQNFVILNTLLSLRKSGRLNKALAKANELH